MLEFADSFVSATSTTLFKKLMTHESDGRRTAIDYTV